MSDQKDNTNTDKYGLGYRHIIIALLFIYFALGSAHKVNLSFGIVSMLDNSHNPKFPQYKWNEEIRGLVLSSLFWGYGLAPIIGGILSHRYGPKRLTLLTMSIASIATILIPFAASVGWIYLCAMRFLIGLTQGFLYPCSYSLVSAWLHPSERSFLLGILFMGEKAGMVLTMAVSGFIAASDIGWPGIFYTTGAAGTVWVVLWYFIGSNTPNESNAISANEREYILSVVNGKDVEETVQLPVPWQKIFTSIPFWSLVITSFTSSWGFYLLLIQIPTYLNGVLHFSLESNALFSAMPYLFMSTLLLIFSYICDKLINRKCVSVGAARKIFNTIGTCAPAITLIWLGYVNSDVTLAVVLLSISVALNSADNVGFLINHIDLSPNFADVLVGLGTVASNLSSILGPLFVGFVVTDTQDASMWRIVFFVTAAVLTTGNIIFVLFGSGNVQNWNYSELKKQSNDFGTFSRSSTIELDNLSG